MELSFHSAEEIIAALRAGAVTSVELTDEAIARIERDDEVINAICLPDFDRARTAARRADQARARGEDRPLLGVPVMVKESYNIAGLPTTWGMPPHRDYVPAEDAVQVSRLRAAGAVVLGKTNVPLGLQDIQSFNDIYGTTNNPWDHSRTPGGSSGGSAAALASGFGALSMELLISGSVARFPLESQEELRIRVAGLSADDRSLDAVRLRALLFSHRDWMEANNRREVHRHGWRQLFGEFDAVVCPITPTPAFPHDHEPNPMERRIDIDGVEYPYFDQLVWAGLATMPGLPATAIPTGRSPEGLPVGVQLIGPMFEDRTSLRLDREFGPAGPDDLDGDPALVTDDTQMALAVAWALRGVDRYTADALEPRLREQFVAWAHSPENNRAPGMTCLRACGGLAEGVPWGEATIAGSKGCGANMRVTPVGLVPGLDLDVLAGVSQLQAAMTHGHPTALASAELTAYATRLLVDGFELADVPAALLARCGERRSIYPHDWLGSLWQMPGATTPDDFIARGWDECVVVLERLVAALARPDDGLDACLATGEGWIAEEALATGLHCAIRHAEDPVRCLVRAARTSGDSDSIAALAGAFVGAAHGLAAWPTDWVARIEYADQLAALTSGVQVRAGGRDRVAGRGASGATSSA